MLHTPSLSQMIVTGKFPGGSAGAVTGFCIDMLWDVVAHNELSLLPCL